MRPFHSTGPRMLTILAALVTLAATSLSASTVAQFNLAEMSRRAQKIYVGTVRSAAEGTLAVGGGQLAVVTYRLAVDEDLLGETAMVKGERVAEIRMLGKQKSVQVGGLRSVSPLPNMPVLAVGQTYLVFTTQPSGVGLSTTVGLGQGCFRLYGKGDGQMAVNEVNNAGLFRDLQPAAAAPAAAAASRTAAPPTAGPMRFVDLRAQIINLVGARR